MSKSNDNCESKHARWLCSEFGFPYPSHHYHLNLLSRELIYWKSIIERANSRGSDYISKMTTHCMVLKPDRSYLHIETQIGWRKIHLPRIIWLWNQTSVFLIRSKNQGWQTSLYSIYPSTIWLETIRRKVMPSDVCRRLWRVSWQYLSKCTF